jgi:hypothetical protein
MCAGRTVLEVTLAGPRGALHQVVLKMPRHYPGLLRQALGACIGLAARAVREGARPWPWQPQPLPPAAWPALAARHVANGWRWLAETLFCHEIWNVGLVEGPADPLAPAPVRWLAPRPPLTYLADPFPYRDSEGWHILVEEYLYGERGHISEVAPDGQVRRVLERPVHLSYPCLVETPEGRYLVPESCAARDCRVYRQIPDGSWVFQGVLLRDQVVIDPTVFFWQGRWWLLFADHQSRLFAYHSPRFPQGPWQAHALNPLKQDVRSSRPGGRPFVHRGRLYRPAQDGSRTYGGALVLNEVEELTPEGFRERPAARLEPRPPYPDGLHHLVVEPDCIFLDGKRLVRDPFFRLRQALRWLRRRV